jgi:tetratricopeptide (TPR) repeat protein
MTKQIVSLLFFFASLSAVYAMPVTEGVPSMPERPALPPVEPMTLPIRSAPEPQARPPKQLVDPDATTPFSRTVWAVVGQHIEIPFTGGGWSYLGELNALKGLTYASHRSEAAGQTFVFSAEKAGEYALQFYKQDFIRDFTLNDAVKVFIGEAPAVSGAGFAAIDRSTVTAMPRWPSADQEALMAGAIPAPASIPAPAQPPVAENSATTATPETIPVVAQPPEKPPADTVLETPDEYIQKAQSEYDAGKTVDALATLDQFLTRFPAGNDEAWWLYAQAFEASGETRDIKSARIYYQRLISEYPLSPHYTAAQSRISYLDRYYFNIQ